MNLDIRNVRDEESRGVVRALSTRPGKGNLRRAQGIDCW